MVSDYEHVEALRKRLLEQKREVEMDLRGIEEMIRVLGDAPRLLGRKPVSKTASDEQEKPVKKTRYNLNLAKLVDEKVADYPLDTAINIGDMIKDLKATAGVVGKDPSLYAYIHALLKKRVGKDLKQEKGVGFFKTRKTEREEQDSQLVASTLTRR